MMTSTVPAEATEVDLRVERWRRLGEYVFARPAAPYRRRWLAIVLYLAMFVGGTMATLFRTDPAAWNLFWAEDGKEFLEDAYRGSFLENLVHPYAGYMHLVPRVVAEPISAVVPADWAAIAFTVSASAVWSAVAVLVFDFARGHVRHLAIRIVLWAMVIFIPVGGLEVVGNIANSHWFLMAAAFWALAARDRGAWQITAASVTVAAAALSDPLTAMLAPLVLLRVLFLRTWRANVVSIVFALTTLLQVLVVLGTDRDTSEVHPSPGAMFRSFVMRVVVGGFVGRTNTDHLRNVIGNDGLYVLGIGILAVLVLIALLCLRRSAMPLIALVFSVAFTLVTTWLTWSALARHAPEFVIIGGSRYSVTPILVMYAVVVIGADLLAGRFAGRARPIAIGALVVVLGALVVTWSADYAPEYRPILPDAGTQYEMHGCDDGVVSIEILPGGGTYWVADLPCAAFED
jgi:hypothetical protein